MDRQSRFHEVIVVFLLCSMMQAYVHAEIALPAVIGDHMVLQRGAEVPIWGWADPDEAVVVTIDEQKHSTTADENGRWIVSLSPLPEGRPLTMTIAGKNSMQLNDILVGEVWVCSGQSNMQWSVSQTWNADLETASAKHPQIRFLTVSTPGLQQPIEDFNEQWQVCSPETVSSFSAVGYYFGRQLQQVLDVPIGLIDNAWGGSSCEAWIRRDLLQDEAMYGPLLERWAKHEADPTLREPYDEFEAARLAWQTDAIAAKKAGQAAPSAPSWPQNNRLVTQHRPGNLYNGRLRPIMPFAIRGAIWYQGESNASRAFQYRELFPLMIENWRNDWGQGEFPFYWVQLADFRQEKDEPGESDWAELREAQTQTLDRLDHTGQAVIIDIGEGADIHPRNKLEVAKRLARLALANDYGLDFASQSPRFHSLKINDDKAELTFRDVGRGLRSVDRRDVIGFAIAGEDRVWHWAQARIEGTDKVIVSSDQVANPTAVRYAWADNPQCNLYTKAGLPVTPFRTDDWPGLTIDSR